MIEMEGGMSGTVALLPSAVRHKAANELAMAIRAIIRAASSDVDDGSKAARHMDRMMELVLSVDMPMNWWDLFSEAIEILRKGLPTRGQQVRYVELARLGMQFFAERSSVDRGANGRSAKQLKRFEAATIRFQESRDTCPEQEASRFVLEQNAERLFGKAK